MFDSIIGIYGKYAKLNSLMVTISGYVLLLMNLIVFYAVIMRYIFSLPPEWTTDWSTFMLLFITFIPAAAVSQNNGHINVDFMMARVTSTTRKYINIFTSLLGAFYFSILLWQSIRLVIKAFSRHWLSIDTGIPLGYPFLLLPIGCVFLVITSLFKAMNILLPNISLSEGEKS